MLVKCHVSTLEHANISHSVTLVPRLEYSINLLDDIVGILKKKRHDLKKLNRSLVADFDDTDNTHLKAIELELIMAFSLETLSKIKKRIGSWRCHGSHMPTYRTMNPIMWSFKSRSKISKRG